MHRYVAEALGTFALVFAGTGAIVVDAASGGAVSHLGIAITFGAVVAAMIYALGDVSGAHLNPAVSVGLWLAGRFPAAQIAPYVASQVVGAVLASVLVRALFGGGASLGATLPQAGAGQSFGLEIVLTLLLTFTILHVTARATLQPGHVAIAVGAVVGLCALFAGPISGASMNPARSLGPALIAGQLEHLWIYLTAPVVGAALAVFACRCSRGDACCSTPVAR